MRASVFVFAGTLAAACGSPRVEAPRAAPPEDVTIAPATAEVWAWDAEVAGTLPHDVAIAACASPAGTRIEGDRWTARVRLHAGENRIRAECTDVRGGGHRSVVAHLRAMLRDAPDARVAVVNGGAMLDARASEGANAPIVAYAWSSEDGDRVHVDGCGPTARVSGEGIVRVEVRDARGRTDVARVRIGSERRGLRDAVVYGVVPPLYPGLGSPLRSVTVALADLADLGVDVLWLSPIFATPPGDYGYAVTDYFRVREDYGDADDLRELVRQAHRRGMRVVLDMVPNHTSDQHRYFVEAERLGRASHYFDFYDRDAQGHATHYFDWKNLPNLHYENPEVRRFMIAASTRWMEEAGVDGYRLDAAWGPRRRDPVFWDVYREDVRSVDPDAILVAEASAREPFWREHGFDAAYDWTDQLGHAAWEDAFRDLDTTADRLDAAVRAAPTRVLRFLENNDTGPRFVTRYGADVTRVAAAALLTLPGTPALFTGQERGAEYEPYAVHAPLTRDDPHDLRPWYRALVALRRALPALRSSAYARVPASDDPRVFAYVRGSLPDVALVVLRFGPRRGRVHLALPDAVAKITEWRDALAPKRDATSSAIDVDLDAWSARVLVPRLAKAASATPDRDERARKDP